MIATLPARITQRDTVFKAQDPDTGLYLRCGRGRPRLDRADLCTWFATREQAQLVISAQFGPSTLEIVRADG